MNRLSINLFAALVALMLLCSCAGSSTKELTGAPIPLADPYIMYYDGIYYAYGTTSNDGIEVFTSPDMKYWTCKGFSLRKEDSWGDTWFWAPEVYHLNGKFYMFYSSDLHICVATASSPLGPFRQEVKTPLLQEEAIDCSLFMDDDGTPYVFFDRFLERNGVRGNAIWVAEMEKDLLKLKEETMHFCIEASQAWEENPTNEGPFVVKHQGLYYMTYSGNSYRNKNYGIGCATATNVMGEWTKYTDNPVFQRPDTLVGVGHHAFFTDADGNFRIAFHSHYNDTTLAPRLMHIGKAGFKKATPHDRLVISQEYFTPRLTQEAASQTP